MKQIWQFLSVIFGIILLTVCDVSGTEKTAAAKYKYKIPSRGIQQRNSQQFTFDDYLEFCQQAAMDDAVFSNFRNNPVYKKYFDNFNKDEGNACLGYILKKDPDFQRFFGKFKEGDAFGTPITYRYYCGYFSSMTLHYVKIACALKQQFGDLSRMHIVEIGGGYGGQCKILADSMGFASYTIVDRPEVLALAKKYLSNFDIDNVYFIESGEVLPEQSYDLLVCDHTFSAIDQTEKENLLHSIISTARNGYAVMGNPLTFSVEDVLGALCRQSKKGKVEKDHDTKRPNNIVATWTTLSSASPSVNLKEPSLRATGNAITYSMNGGRLGDCLIAYLHAKWLAYKFDLPFYYVPFEFSDEFCLTDWDDCLASSNLFQHSGLVTDEDQLSQFTNTLISIPYLPECKLDYELPAFRGVTMGFEVDWDDPGFRAEIKRCLAFKKSFHQIVLPNDCITVGVHVRRGGGMDDPSQFIKFPLKFPPDEYYIEQLKSISRIFKNEKIYVYILTDDQHPASIKERYAAAVNNKMMVFDSHPEGNDFRSNMLADFQLLQQFDCLILCQSNFSVVASKLADYTILVTPIGIANNGRKSPDIDDVEIRFR